VTDNEEVNLLAETLKKKVTITGKVTCEKHGDITDTCFKINYVDQNKIVQSKTYCLACVAEFLDRQLPKVTNNLQKST
jgi:hypothetical protein